MGDSKYPDMGDSKYPDLGDSKYPDLFVIANILTCL